MPVTPTYGLPYEARGELPGRTLNGGLAGEAPILAEAVDSELERLETDLTASVAGVAADLAALTDRYVATGAQVLGVINTGDGGNTTEFNGIPQTYRDLVVIWRGTSDGSGEIDSAALRFNGDGGENYLSVLNRNTGGGAFTSGVGTFSVMRIGHIGTHRSAGTFVIPGYSVAGVSKVAYGSNISVGAGLGVNVFTTWAGGRWSGTAAIGSLRFWPSGQLWDGPPSITLLGVPHGQ